MKRIYFLGECMVELRASQEATMHQSFAGDVYNSAVYLKRCFADINTSMVTAIGQDSMSDKMLETFAQASLNTQMVFRHQTKVPGLYLIETDDAGERSFIYWRNDSAAKKVVEFMNEDVVSQLSAGDMLFISGISIAVIEESARDTFWQIVQRLKAQGVTLVFDPNYRARLWNGPEQARQQFEMAFRLADVALPGVEDLTELYGVDSAQGVLEYCQQFDLQEVVIKNGPASVITRSGSETMTHNITPVTKVVDTTSAGDAFNGVYLGARLCGYPIDKAVSLAANAAGTVIQFPGAIAPEAEFKQAMSEAGL